MNITENPYSVCRREEILRERGYDVLIFRADDTGRLISGIPNSRFVRAGTSVYAGELSGAVRHDYIASMLGGYSRSPFLVSSASGCAVVVRGMVPEANMCAAAIFGCRADEICDIAEDGGLDLLVLPPEASVSGKRRKSTCAESGELVLRAYSLIRDGFYSFQPDDDYVSPTELTDRAVRAAHGLAVFSGCKCVVTDCRSCGSLVPSSPHKHFSGDIFTIFTLLSLTACGRRSLRRDAEMRLGFNDGGFAVEIEAEINDDDTIPRELEECRRIADRRRLFFESAILKGRAHSTLRIRFSPVRYDWSLLGLKASIPFSYD